MNGKLENGDGKRLGALHGAWVLLFKITLAGMPLFAFWATWVTSNIWRIQTWMSQGPRYTQTNATILEARITSQTDAKLSTLNSQVMTELNNIKMSLAKLPEQLPPKWWEDWVRERVKEHDERIKQLEQKNGATQ